MSDAKRVCWWQRESKQNVTVWKLFSNLRKELWATEWWRHLKNSSFGNSLDKRFMTSTRASEERDRKVSYGGTKPVTKDWCRQFDTEACSFNQLHLTPSQWFFDSPTSDAKLAKGMRKTASQFASKRRTCCRQHEQGDEIQFRSLYRY